jgi:hypothetical protein
MESRLIKSLRYSLLSGIEGEGGAPCQIIAGGCDTLGSDSLESFYDNDSGFSFRVRSTASCLMTSCCSSRLDSQPSSRLYYPPSAR